MSGSISSVLIDELQKKVVANAKLFADKNFRAYFLRIGKMDFDALRGEKDPVKQAELYREQEGVAEMLKRQGMINAMYASE
uniref:Isd11 n=1 Tax=Stygiella incarcerata TaxID=1712417 RepID=A0A192ZJ75_9EUKA|nr:Isd11 [Stygiella incarcerata]